MYRKCYTDITALDVQNVGHITDGKWHIFRRINSNLSILVRHKSGKIKFKPLYIHRFQLFAPHNYKESQLFYSKYGSNGSPCDISCTADRLRWYRYRKGLLQREAADYAGIDRATYARYEERGKTCCPLDKLKKLAELFGAEITDLLDEYHTFLYNQGECIRAKRKQAGMTASEFAVYIGVNTKTLHRWEKGEVRVSRKIWERWFK